MPDTLHHDGHLWIRQPDRMCVACGCRTFRMSRRAGNVLLFERYPGPRGNHTFTRARSSARGAVFAICHACFLGRFDGNRQRVLAWADTPTA